MKQAEIFALFESLKVWKRGTQRAPHKPLLVLYVLGRLQAGETVLSFEDARGPVAGLLRRFGRPAKHQHPEYPFWHLQSDRVWQVQGTGAFRLKKGGSSPTATELTRKHAEGELVPEVRRALERSPALSTQVARAILDEHFPDSMHDEILAAVGLTLSPGEIGARRPRDAAFRANVLRAYEQRCAVCGFGLRLDDDLVATEAAHIQWHAARGPDDVTNGLALCVMHHKLFDRGAFTLADDLRLLTSEAAHGSRDLREALLRHHDRPIRKPQRGAYRPLPRHIGWHRREVFRRPARAIGERAPRNAP